MVYPLHSSAFDLEFRGNGELLGMADVVCLRHHPTRVFAELKSYLQTIFSLDLLNLVLAAHPSLAGSALRFHHAGREPDCSLCLRFLASANRGLGLNAGRGEIPCWLRSMEIPQADCCCCNPEPINNAAGSEGASDDQACERPSL